MGFSLLRSTVYVFILLWFSFSVSSVVGDAGTDRLELECLKVPTATFLSSLQNTIEQVREIVALIGRFTFMNENFQVSTAVNDCLDLLDYSIDELNLTVSATEYPHAKGTKHGTGDRRSDLKAWLSAALGNQDTCIDGFGATNSLLGNMIGQNIVQVTSLVTEVLAMVAQGPSPSNNFGPQLEKKFRPSKSFPSWMKTRERGLLQRPIYGVVPDVVVAQDGTGNYTTIRDAVEDAPEKSERRYVIYIKKGLYKENVDIKKKKWNLMMVGDGMNATIISGDRSNGTGYTTFRSATFAVAGVGFIARDLTFENTAGPQNHQAVALRSDSDLSVFYRCGIYGYQDTLYAHSLRQFYRECRITGTVDFIFGNGAVVFQNCQILARKPIENQKNSVTAQGRKDPNQNTGFSFQFCNISVDSDLITSSNTTSSNTTYTYLGRPWKQYSQTIFMQSYISKDIRPEGWLAWQGDMFLDTLFYAEYMNYGPGAGLSNRVKWPGYHPLNQSSQAYNFTVAQFIDGDLWLPSTGVRFTSGLANE